MNSPLISAVVQGLQRGQVFVDHRDHPHSAVAVAHFGFMFLIGEGDEAFDAGLAQAFATNDVLKPSYLLWYSPPLSWQARLDVIPDLVRVRARARFRFSAERAAWLRESTRPPGGYELRKLTADLLPETEGLGPDIASRFWSSAADYEANGLGVCLIKDKKVVSVCYAAAVVDGLAEVDVVTEPDLRGQGLGYVVAQEFIRECRSRNVAPTWDCFLDNVGSTRLAAKLGFVSTHTYPLYSFNTPIATDKVADAVLAARRPAS